MPIRQNARVNNQKVTLSYAPATQADQEALEALLPDGNITDVSQLPDTLPSYIHVKPQLKLNGNVILEGYEMALGESLNIDQAVSPVNAASAGYKKHKSTAGDYLALGTVSQSISPLMLQKLKERMNEVKTILESGDQTAIAALTREDVLGNMHYAMMLGYYMALFGKIEPLQRNFRVFETMTGYGSFGLEVAPKSRFGIPVGVKINGIGLDIPVSKVIVADKNNIENFKQYRLQASAIASSLEHETPEHMYNDPSSEGISTIKAFALANKNNQKIYKINRSNMDILLPKIQASTLVISDIRNALSSGKEIFVHEKPVSVSGWSGTGYIVINNSNYDSAFLIGGGSNGGFELISGLQNFLWIAVAATLGGTDGYTSQGAGKVITWGRLQYLAEMAKISKFLGLTALIFSSIQIISDDNLSNVQKTGLIALNVAAWMATNVLMRTLVVFVPGLAAILGAIIAGIIASIAYYLSETYLSSLNIYHKEHIYA